MAEPLTIDYLLSKNKRIFVKNNTRNPGGRVCLTVPDPASGKSHGLEIPRTWIPVCLSDKLPRQMIDSSIDIRKSIESGALLLVDPDEAEKTLASAEGKAEHDRITKSAHVEKQYADNIRRTAQQSPIKQNIKPATTVTEMNAQAAANTERRKVESPEEIQPVIEQNSGPADGGAPEDSVHQRIVDIVLSIQNQTTNVREAIGEIRAVENELGENDYAYIINNIDESQLKTHAKKMLAQIRGEESPAE